MKLRSISTLILLLCVSACASDEAVIYQLRPVYTTVSFSIMKWMVLKEEGQFREFTGALRYDPVKPENSTVEMTVQAASIDTKNDARDHVLRSEDFFDAEKYPTLSFKSTSVAKNSDGTLTVTGDFTLHGTTRRITIPVKPLGTHEVPTVGKLAGFETSFTLNRRDYGVLGTRWGAVPGVMADDVQIRILAGAIQPSR